MCSMTAGAGSLFQSTHPHGVRQRAPFKYTQRRVFQSTHPHGVRRNAGCGKTAAISFNPRTRMGCDKARWEARRRMIVSIHAPAWGATQPERHKPLHLQFQSTHPHGVRRICPSPAVLSRLFQSTHPHGVRLSALKSLIHLPCFNPRTRMGCDL